MQPTQTGTRVVRRTPQDPANYILQAAYLFSARTEGGPIATGPSSAPCQQSCKSCGGGCYGCKGSSQSKAAIASVRSDEKACPKPTPSLHSA